MSGESHLVYYYGLLTVAYFPLDPTVSAPEGAVVRLAARTAETKAPRVMKKRMVEIFKETSVF